MAVAVLPEELYREIIGHISSKDDLFKLSTTCRTFQFLAEYFLYQDIDSPRWTQTLEWCSLLDSCPRFRPLVRSLKIMTGDTTSLPPTGYWDSVSTILSYLPNLDHLKIYDGVSASNRNARILDRCPSLLRRVETDFEFDEHLFSFFRKQTRLQQVSWVPSVSQDTNNTITQFLNSQRNTPSVLPSITELLTTSAPLTRHLTNTQPMTHLWLCGSPDPRDDREEVWVDYFSQLGPHARSLQSLRVNFPPKRRTATAVLAALARCAPHLRSLGFIPYGDFNGSELFSVLSEFKELRSLVTWNVISSETCRILAESCPSLRLVACLHYSYSHEYVFLPVNPRGTPRPVHDPEFALWRDVDFSGAPKQNQTPV